MLPIGITQYVKKTTWPVCFEENIIVKVHCQSCHFIPIPYEILCLQEVTQLILGNQVVFVKTSLDATKHQKPFLRIDGRIIQNAFKYSINVKIVTLLGILSIYCKADETSITIMRLTESERNPQNPYP